MHYYLVSLGCPKNIVDAEGMGALLDGAGHQPVLDPTEADRWSICHLDPGPGYAGAVAVSGPIGRLACWQWHGASGLCGPE